MDGCHPTARYSPSTSAKVGINQSALIHPDRWESDIYSKSYTLCVPTTCAGYIAGMPGIGVVGPFLFRNHDCKARKSACECCTIARRSKLLVTASMEAAASRISVISNPQFAMIMLSRILHNCSQFFTLRRPFADRCNLNPSSSKSAS